MTATTTNRRLMTWVEEWAAVLQPAQVHWCDGTAEEYDELAAGLVASGTFTPPQRRQAPEFVLGPLGPG